MPSEMIWGIQGACVQQANITQDLQETHSLAEGRVENPRTSLSVHSDLCATLLTLTHFSLELKPLTAAV